MEARLPTLEVEHQEPGEHPQFARLPDRARIQQPSLRAQGKGGAEARECAAPFTPGPSSVGVPEEEDSRLRILRFEALDLFGPLLRACDVSLRIVQ
jgi:hypothetical protein